MRRQNQQQPATSASTETPPPSFNNRQQLNQLITVLQEPIGAKEEQNTEDKRDTRACTILRLLMENNGFHRIADYIEAKHPNSPLLLEFLKRPKAAVILEELMRNKKAFKGQRIALHPETRESFTDHLIGTVDCHPRSAIEILLGAYHTSQIWPIHRYGLACLTAATHAERGNLWSATQQFQYARAMWQAFTTKQKNAVTAPLLITEKTSGSDSEKKAWETQFIATKTASDIATLFLSGLHAHRACQDHLRSAMNYGDLQALDMQITVSNARIAHVEHTLLSTFSWNPVSISIQLKLLVRLLDEQTQYGKLAKETHPGPGNIYYAMTQLNQNRLLKFLINRISRVLDNPTPSHVLQAERLEKWYNQSCTAVRQHLFFALRHQEETRAPSQNAGLARSPLFTVNNEVYRNIVSQAAATLSTKSPLAEEEISSQLKVK